jgi:hypothetical protein
VIQERREPIMDFQSEDQTTIEARKAWVQSQPLVKDILTKRQVFLALQYGQFAHLPYYEDLLMWYKYYDTTHYWNKHKNLISQIQHLTEIDVLNAIDFYCRKLKRDFKDALAEEAAQ